MVEAGDGTIPVSFGVSIGHRTRTWVGRALSSNTNLLMIYVVVHYWRVARAATQWNTRYQCTRGLRGQSAAFQRGGNNIPIPCKSKGHAHY